MQLSQDTRLQIARPMELYIAIKIIFVHQLTHTEKLCAKNFPKLTNTENDETLFPVHFLILEIVVLHPYEKESILNYGSAKPKSQWQSIGTSRAAQRKRAGPITMWAVDRNYSLLV